MGGDYIQWLRGFYYVAKTGSFSLAGAEIGRNQPTISHQIKCLETEYGVILFDRSKEKMELTAEGRMLFEKAISIFEIVKSIEGEITNVGKDLSGKIRIVATHAVIQSFLPKYIIDFSKKNPNVMFEVHGGGMDEILERVETSDADFGFLNFTSTTKILNYYNLFDTNLVLIAPKSSALKKSKRLTLKQISKQPFIFFPHTSAIHPFIVKKFDEKDLKLNVIMVLNNFDIVKQYVQHGMGVTIIDDFMLTDIDYRELKVFPLDHCFDQRHYGMVMRKTKYLSPPVRSFIRTIKPDIEI